MSNPFNCGSSTHFSHFFFLRCIQLQRIRKSIAYYKQLNIYRPILTEEKVNNNSEEKTQNIMDN